MTQEENPYQSPKSSLHPMERKIKSDYRLFDFLDRCQVLLGLMGFALTFIGLITVINWIRAWL